MQKQLLVIDDTELHLTILRKIAAQSGFEATGATSVAEAESLLRKRKFDCITLDLSLGEQSGIDILKLLAALQSKTPVIIISGSDDTFRDETMRVGQSLNLNMFPAIPKPINLAALRYSLAAIVRESARKAERVAPGAW